MQTITENNLPSSCWIYANREYWYYTKNPKNQLPVVNAKYEDILRTYGIPYRKFKESSDSNTEFCEYHNPKLYSTKELSLPLFTKIPDGAYYYCNRNYTGIVVSKECINAAYETRVLVKKAIKDYLAIVDNVSLYRVIKKKLAGNVSKMAYIDSYNFKHVSDVDISYKKCSYSPDCIYNIRMNYDSFIVIRLVSCNWVAIFDMNKINNDSYLYLEVPNRIIALVIGKNGKNIKHWKKEINVKKIHVIPI